MSAPSLSLDAAPLLGALDHLRDALVLVEAKGQVVYQNQTFLDRYGYEHAALNAAGGLTALFPDPAVSRAITAALEARRPLERDVQLCTQEGQVVTSFLRLHPLPDGCMCTFAESADPFTPYDQLRLQAQVIAQIDEAVFAIDQQGTITFFNRGAELLYGVGAAEALGQSVDAFLEAYHHALGKPFLGTALAEDRTLHGEESLELADGRLCEVSIRIKPLREGELFQGRLVIIREITERKQQEARIQHRIHVEGALVEASRLLVSSGLVDFEQVLGVVGQAVGAQSVYLVTIPPDTASLQEIPPQDLGMSLTVWHRDGRSDDDWWPVNLETREPDAFRTEQQQRQHDLTEAHLEPTALAVPVLSHEDMLYGYLGFEYGDRRREGLDEDIRVLNLLGDLFATYFERQFAEQALRESEERYRTFINTTTEAVWRIEFSRLLPTSFAPEEQLDHLLMYGVLAECNEVMARMMGLDDPARLQNMPLRALTLDVDLQLIKDFIQGGYTLRSREYSVSLPEGPQLHFVLNVVGTVENGYLTRIWASCIEVTERVELERRMVAALEEQQQRIGRDLHDGVGQLLTGIRMLSSNLAERYFPDSHDGHEQAYKVARFANEASDRVREIYRGLTPAQLYHEGLSAALEELTYNTNSLPGVSCVFVHDGETDVWEREAKLHLYRIAQEAINNALKHGKPSNIVVALTKQNAHTSLKIEDDGRGFVLEQRRRGKSLGLDSMHYRSRSVGALLTIDSEPDRGTVIRCLFPDES